MTTKGINRKLKKTALTIVITLVVIGGIGFWIFRNSIKSYPGQALYQVKRKGEEIVRITKNTPSEKIEYDLELANKRLSELKKVREDLALVKELMANLNGNIDSWENNYIELAKEGDDKTSFDKFERLNFGIYSFTRTLEASKKTYEDNKDYAAEINQGVSGLRDSVDNIFEISVNYLDQDPEFLKYAIATYEQYQYPRVYQEIQYAKEDFEVIKPMANAEEKADVQKKIDDFQAKYDDMMKRRKEMTAKDIHTTLKDLKKMEYDISLAIVTISSKKAESK